MDTRNFQKAFECLSRCSAEMADAVPPPQLVAVPSAAQSYRYVERSIQQAMVLKMIRTVSALAALQLLAESGLVLDAGAIMRTLDELGTDLMFLAGPSRTGSIEPKHLEYLDEFFQEEFDHPDPLVASQSRRRVSRRDIRAYVARVYSDTAGVSVRNSGVGRLRICARSEHPHTGSL